MSILFSVSILFGVRDCLGSGVSDFAVAMALPPEYITLGIRRPSSEGRAPRSESHEKPDKCLPRPAPNQCFTHANADEDRRQPQKRSSMQPSFSHEIMPDCDQCQDQETSPPIT